MVALDCESHPEPTWENAAYFTVKRSPEGMLAELRVPQELRSVVEKDIDVTARLKIVSFEASL